MKKAQTGDYEGRIRQVVSDPNNIYIPRVANAGEVIGDYQIMHNGIKVLAGGYCRGLIDKMLKVNKGVHEPQEERVFMEVLRYMAPESTMIELGSWWAFYSMWFYNEVKDAQCFMIEPDKNLMEIGKKNFIANQMKGDFTLGNIGDRGIKIDDYIKEKGIDFVDILHSDIQGAELQMLQGAERAIDEGKIGYFFIGTHRQKLHYDCLSFLKAHDYIIITSIDFDNETYCFDGVLVARLAKHVGIDPMEIFKR